jgi:hypothetical protein
MIYPCEQLPINLIVGSSILFKTVAIVKERGEHVTATTSAAAIADRPNGILLPEDHSGLFWLLNRPL